MTIMEGELLRLLHDLVNELVGELVLKLVGVGVSGHREEPDKVVALTRFAPLVQLIVPRPLNEPLKRK